MTQKEEAYRFEREMVLEGDAPRVYLVPATGKTEPAAAPAEGKAPRPSQLSAGDRPVPSTFFGHSIGEILDPSRNAAEELRSLDERLASAMGTVQSKLEAAKRARILQRDPGSREEEKHRRFLEERNRAQETLFSEIADCHQAFDTGLATGDLWKLHARMHQASGQEDHCSLGDTLHEMVECNLLRFLRRKSVEIAWDRVLNCLSAKGIPFPFSPAMEDPDNAGRSEQIRVETQRARGVELTETPSLLLAELILGNVPGWVYSYPARGSYLWQTTLYQGVAAGLAADGLFNILATWEKHSVEILKDVEQRFSEQIDLVRQKGQAASGISEVLSVSRGIEQLSTREIPEAIWEHLSQTISRTPPSSSSL